MKFVSSGIGFALAVTMLAYAFPAPAFAGEFQLKPYKDKLFKYRKPLKVEDDGDFVRAPYDPLRDINARDEVPVRKVKTYYTSARPHTSPKRYGIHRQWSQHHVFWRWRIGR